MTKFKIFKLWCLFVLYSATVFASDNPFEIPKGETINVDGKMNEDEWKDALPQDFKNGGKIKLKHDGEFLEIGLQGVTAGLAHVYVFDGKDVYVFHASAALGMLTYQKSGEIWNTTQKFNWDLRDQATNAEGSSTYLKTNGWLASVGNPPTAAREYKIAMKYKEGEDFRIAVVYFANPTGLQFFPSTLADDTLSQKLLFGGEPTNLVFKNEQWASLKLKLEN